MTNAKTKRVYLMTAGTLLPAFAAISARMAYKRSVTLEMTDLLLFAGTSILGGYITAKMLKSN